MNLRLNENFLFSQFYKSYLNGYFFPENVDDFIYFKNKSFKNNKIERKTYWDKISFLYAIASYPRIIISNFAKMSYGRKLVVFIMMSFISYLMLVISHILKNKEKYEL